MTDDFKPRQDAHDMAQIGKCYTRLEKMCREYGIERTIASAYVSWAINEAFLHVKLTGGNIDTVVDIAEYSLKLRLERKI